MWFWIGVLAVVLYRMHTWPGCSMQLTPAHLVKHEIKPYDCLVDCIGFEERRGFIECNSWKKSQCFHVSAVYEFPEDNMRCVVKPAKGSPKPFKDAQTFEVSAYMHTFYALDSIESFSKPFFNNSHCSQTPNTQQDCELLFISHITYPLVLPILLWLYMWI